MLRPNSRLFFAALCAIAAAPASAGTWTTVGPYGGGVASLAIDPSSPSTVYAGTDEAGIFKSTDGGSSWTASSNGLGRTPDAHVASLVIDPTAPTTLYAGLYRGPNSPSGIGAFKSADGGATWTKLTGLGTRAVLSMALDPHTPTTLYAGISDPNCLGGVFKSTDAGTTWVQLTMTGNNILCIYTVVVDPQTSSTIYAGGVTGIWKSTDGGASFAQTGMTSQTRAIAIDPTNTSTLYAGLDNLGGVSKSTDGGATWTAINGGFPAMLSIGALVVDPTASSTVYAVIYGLSGIYKTTNGGASWSAVNSGLGSLVINALAISPTSSSRLLAGSVNGIYSTTTGGGSWLSTYRGLAAIPIGSVATVAVGSGSVSFAGASSDTSASASALDGIYREAQGPHPGWGRATASSGGSRAIAISPDFQDFQSIFAGMSLDLVSSDDGGFSWSPADSGLPLPVIVQALAIDPTSVQFGALTVYAGLLAGGVYVTTDSGNSWSPTGLTANDVRALALDPSSSPTTIYAAAASSGVFKSTDAGTTFTETNAGLPTISKNSLTSIAVDLSNPSTLYLGVGTSSPAAGGVFRSSDGGATWSQSNSGLTDLNVRAVAVDPGTHHAFAGTFQTGVFESADGGASWTAANTGLTDLAIASLSTRLGAVVAGGAGGGVFEMATAIPDTTPPTIAIDAPVDGASYPLNDSILASYSCSDPSGVASCVGPVPSGSPIDTSSVGSHDFTVTAQDLVGNSGSLTHTYQVVPPDTDPPAIAIGVPPDGAVYTLGESVLASYSCSDPDGVSSCSGPVPDGSLIDTSSLGSHDFTVAAQDGLGNAGSLTHTYRVATACSDGIDNDGDGLIDYPADPGCTSAADNSENEATLPCDDGIDNDGDGLVDYRADGTGDPGCAYPAFPTESPACDDGIDNDGDGKIDFDGGASATGGAINGTPDPGCSHPYGKSEVDPPHCGLGAELGLLMVAIEALRRRRHARG